MASHLAHLSGTDYLKAIGVGLLTSLVMLIVMKALFAAGLAPMPMPPSEAFAEKIAGTAATGPLAAIVHFIYGTVWAVIYVAAFRHNLTFMNALWIGLAMWAIAVVIFFPFVGWGFFGLSIAPMTPIAALVVHLVYLTVLWFLARLMFQSHMAHPV